MPGHSRGGLFGSYACKQFLQLLALLVEAAHLLEDTKRDMVAARLTGTLAELQVGFFLLPTISLALSLPFVVSVPNER